MWRVNLTAIHTGIQLWCVVLPTHWEKSVLYSTTMVKYFQNDQKERKKNRQNSAHYDTMLMLIITLESFKLKRESRRKRVVNLAFLMVWKHLLSCLSPRQGGFQSSCWGDPWTDSSAALQIHTAKKLQTLWLVCQWQKGTYQLIKHYSSHLSIVIRHC